MRFPAQADDAAGLASIIAMADAGAGGWGQSSRYLLLFAAGTAVGSAIALGAAYGFSSALAAARAEGGDAGASRREGRSARCGPAHLLLAHRAQEQHRTDDDACDCTRQQRMLSLMVAPAWVEGAMQARRGCQTLVLHAPPCPLHHRHGTHKQGDRSSHEGYGRPSKVRTIHWVCSVHVRGRGSGLITGVFGLLRERWLCLSWQQPLSSQLHELAAAAGPTTAQTCSSI